MKFNDANIGHCREDIFNNVLRYAYENAKVPPLLTELTPEWHGEIFNSNEIETIFFRDSILQLKRLGLFEKIKEETDKFVVFPDVFSEQAFPSAYYNSSQVTDNSVRDYGLTNLVTINGYLFELIDEKLDGIHFCYAGKMYYFYDSSIPEASKLVSSKPSLKVIDVKKYTEFDFDEKYPIGVPVEGSLLLQLDINNKVIVDPFDGDYLTLRIDYPHVRFNYDEASVIDKSNIKGGFSTQHLDVFIQEKILEIREDKFIMHRRNASFCETAIVINKDNSYRIVNDTFSVELNRIDKHTIEFYRNPNVKEIIVFYKPILMDTNSLRVDSLYDNVMKISDNGYYDLRKYTKNTTSLYNWLVNKYPSTKEIVDYGYNYDVDVLKAVKLAFPTKLRLSEIHLTVSKIDVNGNTSHKNQLFLNIPNNIMLNPLIFLDGKLYDYDTINYSRQKLTTVHLNMNSLPIVNDILINSNDPENEVREYFKDVRIEVALLSNISDGIQTYNYKEFKTRIAETPCTVVSRSEFENVSNSTFFVNGRASIGTEHETLLYTTPVYGIGMSTDLKVLLLTSKIDYTDYRFIKLNHIEPFIELRHDKYNEGLFNIDKEFSESGYLAFNFDGILMNDDLQIITNDYATFDSRIKRYKGQDTVGMRYIRLPAINITEGLDLEIDESRINRVTNIGSYNERSLETNPYILDHFKTGMSFLETGYENDIIDSVTLKGLSDIVSTFGSVGTKPYNTNDYRVHLDLQNISIIDSQTFIPDFAFLPPKYSGVYKYNHIALKIYSNMWFSEYLKSAEKLSASFNPDFECAMNEQMKYQLTDGLVVGGDVKLILSDVDTKMTFTPNFLNPPEHKPVSMNLNGSINMNFAMDKQQFITLPTTKLDINEFVNPVLRFSKWSELVKEHTSWSSVITKFSKWSELIPASYNIKEV